MNFDIEMYHAIINKYLGAISSGLKQLGHEPYHSHPTGQGQGQGQEIVGLYS
jgi:hypothetical protein